MTQDRRVSPGLPTMRRVALVAVFLVLPLLALRQWPASEANWNDLDAEARMLLGFEAQTRRALSAGELPLWNPYHLGGRPHLADPATLALYPPHVALRALPIDTFFAMSFAFHAWIFGLGAYLVARQVGAPRLASLLGSTGVALVAILTPNVGLAYAPSAYSVAWLPLIVALSTRASQRPGALPSVGLVAAAVMAMTGLPRGQVYAVAAMAACYVFAALWPGGRERSRKALMVQAAALACLTLGLSAFQLAPQVRLRTMAAHAGGLAHDDVRTRATFDAHHELDRLIATAVSSDRARVLSQCDTLDASRLLWRGIPGVDGYGGGFVADYGRFAAIVSDTRVDASRGPATMKTPVRSDLLLLLNAGVLVTCSPVETDRWDVAAEVEGATLARARHALPRAFWTCAPSRVTREEIEYRLRNFRYDETLTLREANPVIHIRWAAGLDATARLRFETELNVRPRRFIDGNTWQYDLNDATRANLARIVAHQAVEDTAGFERGALTLPPPSEAQAFAGRRSEWLLGLDSCEDARPAIVEEMDRADGRLVATIDAPRDGLLFVSETYFAGRTAWLDGARVDPLKVNLAFTGIPVTAGHHRVELRADPTPLAVGAGITLFTLIAWPICGWRMRVR